MKKAIAITLVALASFLMLAVAASADGVNDPGSGCNDQVNGSSCVPDPQPTNGQDCEAHGANADGNENHCTTTTVVSTTTPVTTTATSTTSTTVVDTTTTETTSATSTTATTVSEVPPITTSSPSPSTETTSPTSTTTSGSVVTTEATRTQSETSSAGDKSPREGKLAFTGPENVVPLAAAALATLTLGSGLLWAGRKRDAE